MNIHQSSPDFTKNFQGYWCIVDECPAFSLGTNFTANDCLISIVKVSFFKKTFQPVWFYFECSLSYAFLRFVPKHLGVGTVTQQQAHGSKHDRLTCTCLTGYNGELSGGPQLQVMD